MLCDLVCEINNKINHELRSIPELFLTFNIF